MAKSAGKDMLVYKGVSPSGVLIGSCTATSIQINSEAVEITNKGSSGWRDLLANAGVKSAQMTVSGLLDASATADPLLTDAIDGSIDAYYFAFNNGDLLVGSFQVTDWSAKGSFNDAQEFSATFTSSGAVTYTNT